MASSCSSYLASSLTSFDSFEYRANSLNMAPQCSTFSKVPLLVFWLPISGTITEYHVTYRHGHYVKACLLGLPSSVHVAIC